MKKLRSEKLRADFSFPKLRSRGNKRAVLAKVPSFWFWGSVILFLVPSFRLWVSVVPVFVPSFRFGGSGNLRQNHGCHFRHEHFCVEIARAFLAVVLWQHPIWAPGKELMCLFPGKNPPKMTHMNFFGDFGVKKGGPQRPILDHKKFSAFSLPSELPKGPLRTKNTTALESLEFATAVVLAYPYLFPASFPWENGHF